MIRNILLAVMLSILPLSSAFAQSGGVDSGDTAWMLVSALLVLMMTIPGLALFYGGLVKKDNVLTTLMQSVGCCVLVSVIWPVIGYTLAFSDGGFLIGGLDKLFLSGVGPDSLVGTIPESVFIVFQMTFAVITAALLIGAVADRVKFTSLLVFIPLWLVLVYAPIAHWVWGAGGFIGGIGLDGYRGFLGFGEALDFAGGTVVHINSGVAGLVAAIVIGRGMKTRRDASTPPNLILSVIGAGLLWVGWFGFNAGSALSAGTSAGFAMLVTNSAAGIAALVWMALEMLDRGKISVQGTLSGIVAGLVAITPAAGFVDFGASLIIGAVSAIVCYVAVTHLKEILKYDDALDVFGLHGIGGIVGAILVGVFANPEIGGAAGLVYGDGQRVIAQLLSVIVTIVYSGVGTWVLLIFVKKFFGLRVNPKVEYWGLDFAHHGETLSEYNEIILRDYPETESGIKKVKKAVKKAKKKVATKASTVKKTASPKKSTSSTKKAAPKAKSTTTKKKATKTTKTKS